jgi:hypothetical protein
MNAWNLLGKNLLLLAVVVLLASGYATPCALSPCSSPNVDGPTRPE